MKKAIILSITVAFFMTPLTYGQEKITLSTYYPAPFGVYNQMVTKTLGVGDNDGFNGLDANDTPDASDPDQEGDVWIAGDVGIGTTSPQARFDVNGSVKLGGDPRGCGDNGAQAGTVRYESGELEYCDGIVWKRTGGGFPSPNFDSGWINFDPVLDPRFTFDGEKYRLNFNYFSHTLGKNRDEFLVDVEYKVPVNVVAGNLGVTEFGSGGGGLDLVWRNLTVNSISLDKKHTQQGIIDKVRIRIWDYSQ